MTADLTPRAYMIFVVIALAVTSILPGLLALAALT